MTTFADQLKPYDNDVLFVAITLGCLAEEHRQDGKHAIANGLDKAMYSLRALHDSSGLPHWTLEEMDAMQPGEDDTFRDLVTKYRDRFITAQSVCIATAVLINDPTIKGAMKDAAEEIGRVIREGSKR